MKNCTNCFHADYRDSCTLDFACETNDFEFWKGYVTVYPKIPPVKSQIHIDDKYYGTDEELPSQTSRGKKSFNEWTKKLNEM